MSLSSSEESSSLEATLDEALQEDVSSAPLPHRRSSVERILEELRPKKTESFLKYDRKPFSSFKHSIDNLDEEIFDSFKTWLLEQHETFLYTFEGPSKKWGEHPFFHIGTSKEEKEAATAEEKEELMKYKAVDDFVKKRLQLIYRLIRVYKKAKKCINAEFFDRLIEEDPFCENKRKETIKKVAVMMVKQMALEYIYLKAQKLKKDIEYENKKISSFVDVEETIVSKIQSLQRTLDYTLKTAEKLRLLIELECVDESDKEVENLFNIRILKNMARMYLHEIERLVMCRRTKNVVTEKKSPDEESEFDNEQFNTLIEKYEKKVLDVIKAQENEAMEQEIEQNVLSESSDVNRKEEGKSIDGTEGDYVPTSSLVRSEELFLEEENLTHRATAGTNSDTFRGTEELDDTRESGASSPVKEETELGVEVEEPIEVVIEEHTEEEYKGGSATSHEKASRRDSELSKHDIQLYESFKRELWINNAFHFFTHTVIPELAGRYKLVHTVNNILPDEESVINEGEDNMRKTLTHSSMNILPTLEKGGETGIAISRKSLGLKSEEKTEEESELSIVSYEVSSSKVIFKDQLEEVAFIGFDEDYTPGEAILFIDDTKSFVSSVGEYEESKDVCETFTEIMKYFTEYLKTDSDEEQEEGTAEEEIIEDYPRNWTNTKIKWQMPERKESDMNALRGCKQDEVNEFKEKLHISNNHFMKHHPEISAMILLLLRDFLKEKPSNHFERFAKEVIFKKNFAKHLTKYLIVNNEEYRSMFPKKKTNCRVTRRSHVVERCRQFEFDMSEEDYWLLWGADPPGAEREAAREAEPCRCQPPCASLGPCLRPAQAPRPWKDLIAATHRALRSSKQQEAAHVRLLSQDPKPSVPPSLDHLFICVYNKCTESMSPDCNSLV